jgi:hypothetical protein
MSFRLAFSSRIVAAGLVFGLGLCFAGSAVGQRIDDGEEALRKKDSRRVDDTDGSQVPLRKYRDNLLKGKEGLDPNTQTSKEALDLGAKLMTYRYAWKEYHKVGPEALKAKIHIHIIFEELESVLGTMASPKYRGSNKDATRLFCQQIIFRGDEVLKAELAGDRPRPITLVNTTRALARLVDRGLAQSDKDWSEEVVPRMAGENAEKLAAALLPLLKVKEPKGNDGMRYYALRGLAGLLAMPKQMPDVLKDGRDKIAKEVLVFAGELNKRKFPGSATRPEREGFKALRREAVRVIARYPSPFIGDKEYPALFLARIAGNDKGLNLEPRLDERLEAAMGLARMHVTGPMANAYHPDYAAEQIGKFVRDFAVAANAERETSKAVKRTRPWKVEAARMNDALAVLGSNYKTAYVGEVVKRARAVLGRVEQGKVESGAADFGVWIESTPSPTQKQLYRDLADSVITERKSEE